MEERLFSVGLFSRRHNGLYIAEYYFMQKNIPIILTGVEECAGFGMSVYHGEKTNHVVNVPGGYLTGHVLTLGGDTDAFASFFSELDKREKERYGAEREKRMFGVNGSHARTVAADTYLLYDARDYKGDDGPLRPYKKEFTDSEIREALKEMGVALSA